ncbi:MAG: hypothetical protein AAGA16_06765 [Cyanobacteria bacterium P01_E01_bin.35]
MSCLRTVMEKPTEDLAIALESEVLGEAFFRSAYYVTFFGDRRNKVKILWWLETQTKKRILEYFEVNSIKVPKSRRTVVKGSILGVFCSVAPWNIILQEILKETECYLEVFCRLKEQAAEKDQELFEYIVAHEAAIRQFVEIELVNDGNNSLEPIEALLND